MVSVMRRFGPQCFCHQSKKISPPPSFFPLRAPFFISPSLGGTNHLAPTLMGLVRTLCLPPFLPLLSFFFHILEPILQLVSFGTLWKRTSGPSQQRALEGYCEGRQSLVSFESFCWCNVPDTVTFISTLNSK